MDSNVMLVVGCVELLGQENQCNRNMQVMSLFVYENNEIFKKVFEKPITNTSWGETQLKPFKLNILYKNLKEYSIIDLIKFLQSLIPFASNASGCGSSGTVHSMITTLNMAIQTLTTEINNLSDDSKNLHDLINTNQQLKMKCEKLENELNAIKQIINKT